MACFGPRANEVKSSTVEANDEEFHFGGWGLGDKEIREIIAALNTILSSLVLSISFQQDFLYKVDAFVLCLVVGADQQFGNKTHDEKLDA